MLNFQKFKIAQLFNTGIFYYYYTPNLRLKIMFTMQKG